MVLKCTDVEIEMEIWVSMTTALPSSFVFQSGVDGDLPYVTTDYSFELTGAGKLHVFKGLARPGFVKAK